MTMPATMTMPASTCFAGGPTRTRHRQRREEGGLQQELLQPQCRASDTRLRRSRANCSTSRGFVRRNRRCRVLCIGPTRQGAMMTEVWRVHSRGHSSPGNGREIESSQGRIPEAWEFRQRMQREGIRSRNGLMGSMAGLRSGPTHPMRGDRGQSTTRWS